MKKPNGIKQMKGILAKLENMKDLEPSPLIYPMAKHE
jgi:hypothetical protein